MLQTIFTDDYQRFDLADNIAKRNYVEGNRGRGQFILQIAYFLAGQPGDLYVATDYV